MNHTPRRIVANTALYTGTLVLQKIISFAYFWFLSARLAPELLGTYIWALSLTTLFSIGVDAGLSPLLIREAARDPTCSERLLRGVLGLKCIFGIITLGVLSMTLMMSHRDAITIMVVAVASMVMIFDSFAMTFWSVLRARQVVVYESVGLLLFHVLVFSLGAYALHVARSPFAAMIALAVGSISTCLYALMVVRFRFNIRIAPRFESETLRALIRLLPAFAIAGVFIRIYNATDSVLLGLLIGNSAVGLYSVPLKVITALQVLIPGAFIASIYPAMSHAYSTNRAYLAQIFERSLGYLVLFALPITAALLVLIPRVLTAVWPQYRMIEQTFFIMMCGLPFLFLTFSTGYLLNAADRQRANTTNRGIVTVVSVLLNIFFIPLFGVLGAGLAFAVTNITLFLLDLYRVRQVISFSWRWLLTVFVKSGVATIVMASVLWMARGVLPLLVLVGTGAVVYGAMLVMVRVLSKEERMMIRQLFGRKPVTAEEVTPL